ncbi:uncharacterized protein (TIGR02453 family) [Luteibacter rhizovicinus]|uniref:Uncharacterized protein (TIGR02453 family) n=1 Tax=Luteibacter rhizovicinus TaxID=242606 RepID=A0A4V6P479_9GAMM|nr:DUF2461 domain-containing protein [Luteibacter rhizovicinus]TCV97579.1 uncharacterized protein (TIGR02453 family) [Luteibacter rhizovicinus]
MSHAYFSPATFRFLKSLVRNNRREWFHEHKDDYECHVRDPFLQLITDLQAPLAKISGHYRADPRKAGGSLFRIHRDTRFANDKQPYKGWASARFFHERRHEIQAPAFYLHIQPGECFAGGGLWHPEPVALKQIRAFLADNPEAWKRATRSKAFADRFSFWGESLTRPPRGFDPAHELIDDLKRKNFAAGENFDEALACSTELLPHVVSTFKRLAPMVDYLCAAQELEF